MLSLSIWIQVIARPFQEILVINYILQKKKQSTHKFIFQIWKKQTMSHIVVSCKCHIDAYNKIHLGSSIPHSHHSSHGRSTRENKERKRSAVGKALELTRSHQKRHIS